MDVRLHEYEADRLGSLWSYGLLDVEPLADLDAVTRLAARVSGAERAELNLVDRDRQYTLSAFGGPRGQVDRSQSICSDVVAAHAPVVLNDMRWLERYAGLGSVRSGPGLRAYAGVPLIGRDGLPLGALCALDTRPRVFTRDELADLTGLARQAVAVIELHRRDTAVGMTAARLVPEVHEPAALQRAVRGGELVPHFQPVVDLATDRIVSFEALMRWEHPTRGVLTPDRFLPGLEAGHLVHWASRLVLDRVCRLLVRLRALDVALPGGIAINVGSNHLATPGLAGRIVDRLAEDGLPGTALTVELTETTDTGDTAVARRELDVLRGAGVRVVADDFGVGWSNLTRLLDLPMSGIKIDRHLVEGIAEDRVRQDMVRSAVALAHRLGLDVVAEGVETEPIRDTVHALGCDRGQGWLFGRPVPADRVPDLLAGRARGSAVDALRGRGADLSSAR